MPDLLVTLIAVIIYVKISLEHRNKIAETVSEDIDDDRKHIRYSELNRLLIIYYVQSALRTCEENISYRIKQNE